MGIVEASTSQRPKVKARFLLKAVRVFLRFKLVQYSKHVKLTLG